MFVLPRLREPISLTPARTGALAADELSPLAFAWIVGGPVPNQQRPDSPRHQNHSHPDGAPLWNMSKGRAVVPHSVGLRTGPTWVLMISVLVAAADTDAVAAGPNHPHTEGSPSRQGSLDRTRQTAHSPPTAGTPLSAYDTNRSTASSIAI